MGLQKTDWIKYGIDLLIVILGILIAFQLNNWANGRSDKKTISTHLQQLKSETDFNKQSLGQSITNCKDLIGSIDSILFYLNDEINYDAANRYSFSLLSANASYLRKNAYRSLVESGDFQLIKDFNTKQQIVDLYEYYDYVELTDEISRSVLMDELFPYINTNFDLITGATQSPEIYQNKQFKNSVLSYKVTTANQLKIFERCMTEMNSYLGN